MGRPPLLRRRWGGGAASPPRGPSWGTCSRGAPAGSSRATRDRHCAWRVLAVRPRVLPWVRSAGTSAAAGFPPGRGSSAGLGGCPPVSAALLSPLLTPPGAAVSRCRTGPRLVSLTQTRLLCRPLPCALPRGGPDAAPSPVRRRFSAGDGVVVCRRWGGGCRVRSPPAMSESPARCRARALSHQGACPAPGRSVAWSRPRPRRAVPGRPRGVGGERWRGAFVPSHPHFPARPPSSSSEGAVAVLVRGAAPCRRGGGEARVSRSLTPPRSRTAACVRARARGGRGSARGVGPRPPSSLTSHRLPSRVPRRVVSGSPRWPHGCDRRVRSRAPGPSRARPSVALCSFAGGCGRAPPLAGSMPPRARLGLPPGSAGRAEWVRLAARAGGERRARGRPAVGRVSGSLRAPRSPPPSRVCRRRRRSRRGPPLRTRGRERSPLPTTPRTLPACPATRRSREGRCLPWLAALLPG